MAKVDASCGGRIVESFPMENTCDDRFNQLKAAGDLPSPKGVALAIMRLTQKDDVTSSELEQTIKSDPAFVARLLKAANGVGRAGGRPVAAVADALIVLGMAVVRNLSLSFSLVSAYRFGGCKGFDYDRYWSRSLLFGLALQEVVRQCHLANAEEAFCCGLLADIGQLALATLYPRDYGRLLQELGKADPAALEGGGEPGDVARQRLRVENETFAIDYLQLGAAMLVEWGLPQVLVGPLSRRLASESGFPEGSRQDRLWCGILLAGEIADACLLDEAARREFLPGLLDRAEQLELPREALLSLCDRVAGAWVEWGDTLEVGASRLASFVSLEQEIGGDAQPLRALIVVDDATSRELIRRQLEELGFAVVSLQDEAGLEVGMVEFDPHLLVADAALRANRNMTLVRTLRETRQGRTLYILLVADAGDEEATLRALDAGADDFIVRPIHERLLAARLKSGERLIRMQEEIRIDHEEIRHVAAELAVSNRRLQEVAVTDPLTGFHNRRYAMDRLEREWQAMQGSGRPLSCMMIDLDEFKQVNDRYGHDVGDALLREVAQVMRSNLRSQDVICRIGGDEFLVLSPETDAVAVRACAGRLLDAVNKTVLVAGKVGLAGRLSIGVATANRETADMQALLKAADSSMYRAKQSGRNQVGD